MTTDGFLRVAVGHADRTVKFCDPTGVPSTYDPATGPWYKQAAAAGKAVVTAPYVDAGLSKLVVTFAVPIIREGSLKRLVRLWPSEAGGRQHDDRNRDLGIERGNKHELDYKHGR